MVQREVADRIVAVPGTRDYGLLSVTVQMYGPVARLFTLPPSAFSPPPDVHSTVFRWRFAPRFAELGVEEAGFLRFARQVFAQKRKTLANNLRAAGYEPADVQTALGGRFDCCAGPRRGIVAGETCCALGFPAHRKGRFS